MLLKSFSPVLLITGGITSLRFYFHHYVLLSEKKRVVLLLTIYFHQQLYSNFIISVEARFNQVKLATLISLIGNSVTDTSIALDLYQKVLLSRERLGREAALCLDMEIAIIYMKIGKLDLAKASLEVAKEQIPSINSMEAVAFSKFYMATAEYRKASNYFLIFFVIYHPFNINIIFLQLVGPPQEFYNAALMFLSYTHVDDLSSESKYILATDMALASITGDDIFNFGEVIATPILSVLVGTPNQWLRDLVYALNSGKIDDFNLIVGANKESYSQQPALANRHEIVKQKVVLLCVLNIAFERSANDRLIPFEEIAVTARIPIDQVSVTKIALLSSSTL